MVVMMVVHRVLHHVVVMMVMVMNRVLHHVVVVMVHRRSGQRRRRGKTDNHRRGDQQILNHSLSP